MDKKIFGKRKAKCWRREWINFGHEDAGCGHDTLRILDNITKEYLTE
jgi:hypothetical protein